MKAAELESMRVRDRGMENYTLAMADRRALLAYVEHLQATLRRAYNTFENITVADTLDAAKAKAHQFIGSVPSEPTQGEGKS